MKRRKENLDGGWENLIFIVEEDSDYYLKKLISVLLNGGLTVLNDC